jgi:predicted RNase H-like nuclease (RuvC/YqgF family)
MKTCPRCGYVPGCDDTRDAMVEVRRQEINSLRKQLKESNEEIESLKKKLFATHNYLKE